MHGGDGGKLLISVLTFAKCVRTHSLNIAGGGSLARVQFHFHRKSRESGEEQRREEEKKKEKKQKKFIIVPGRFQQRRSPADVVRKVPTETKRNERKRRKGNFFELRETGRKTGSFSLAFNQSTIHALYFKSRRGRGGEGVGGTACEINFRDREGNFLRRGAQCCISTEEWRQARTTRILFMKDRRSRARRHKAFCHWADALYSTRVVSYVT